MNAMSNNKLNNVRVWKGSIWIFILISLPLMSNADTHNQNLSQSESSENSIDTLVWEVLKSTERSLSLVESNTQDSLEHVENALASISEIKNQLSADTHIDNKTPLVVGESQEYWFLYPRISEDIMNNKIDFPTLHSKVESGIIYRGDFPNKTQNEEEVATYFDYAFAYASLKMAREALTVTNYREAKSSLAWVFDAIYISPDFYVAQYGDKVKIDNLLNINGEFPRFSNRTQ